MTTNIFQGHDFDAAENTLWDAALYLYRNLDGVEDVTRDDDANVVVIFANGDKFVAGEETAGDDEPGERMITWAEYAGDELVSSSEWAPSLVAFANDVRARSERA